MCFKRFSLPVAGRCQGLHGQPGRRPGCAPPHWHRRPCDSCRYRSHYSGRCPQRPPHQTGFHRGHRPSREHPAGLQRRHRQTRRNGLRSEYLRRNTRVLHLHRRLHPRRQSVLRGSIEMPDQVGHDGGTELVTGGHLASRFSFSSSLYLLK